MYRKPSKEMALQVHIYLYQLARSSTPGGVLHLEAALQGHRAAKGTRAVSWLYVHVRHPSFLSTALFYDAALGFVLKPSGDLTDTILDLRAQ